MCLALGAGHGAPDLIWCGGHVPLLGTIAPPAQKHCVQLTASLLQHPDTSGHLCRELFRFPGKGKVELLELVLELGGGVSAQALDQNNPCW